MLSFVINTDLTITTEKLVELFATLDDEFMVHDLRSQLDLPVPKVEKMKYRYGTPFQRRDTYMYLNLYATAHPCPSWRQVAKVLHRVGLPHQARVVESTYVRGNTIILSQGGYTSLNKSK